MGRPQDAAALGHALAALAAPIACTAGARVLRPFGRRTTLGTLLAALDGVVMPQTLRVSDAGGVTLSLDAANRRLLSVRPGPGAAIAQCTPDPHDPAGLDRLGAALAAFAARGPLRLVPGGGGGAAGQRGVAVADLAARWGEAIAPHPAPAPHEILDHAIAAHPDRVIAWLAVKDGASDGDGDPAALADLDALAAALGAGAGALSEGAMVAASRPDHALALVHTGGALIGLAAWPAAGEAIASTLQESLLGWN